VVVGKGLLCLQRRCGDWGAHHLRSRSVSSRKRADATREGDMGVEIVRVRGTAAAARDDDVAAASAGYAAVFAKMGKHKRTDPALVVVVQVSHHPSPASADTVCEHACVCLHASGCRG
jgi:hypothetical protein